MFHLNVAATEDIYGCDGLELLKARGQDAQGGLFSASWSPSAQAYQPSSATMASRNTLPLHLDGNSPDIRRDDVTAGERFLVDAGRKRAPWLTNAWALEHRRSSKHKPCLIHWSQR